jgi:aspartyl protease family protein
VRSRLFWILLLGLAIALLMLIARHDSGTVAGLSTNDYAALVYYAVLIVFLGGTLVAMFRRQFSRALRAALVWIAIGLALVVIYTYRTELRFVSDRVLAELIPGRVANRGVLTVEIVRGRAGDFQVATQINGVRVSMVLDTGASAVVLTQEAAKAVGLPLEVLVYDVNVDTANGRTRAASVTLDRLGVGSIVERSVPALIAQPGQLRTSLLGMSFLNRLESYEVRTDKLLMRGYQ